MYKHIVLHNGKTLVCPLSADEPIKLSIALIASKLKRWVLLGSLSTIFVGCVTLPTPAAPAIVPTPPAPAFVTTTATIALPRLIAAERQAALDQDLALLAQLWTEASRIVDGRGTAVTNDDYIWAGRAAILDRYRVAVFVNPPPPLTMPANLNIQLDGQTASTRLGQDQWQFVREGERWWLAELHYSQPEEE